MITSLCRSDVQPINVKCLLMTKIIFCFDSCQLANPDLKFSFEPILVVKKLVTIILILVYSMSALGMPVRYHYCNDWLTALSISVKTHHDCPCNTSGAAAGCCKDKVFYLKGDSHRGGSQFLQADPMNGLQTDPPVLITLSVFKNDEEVFGLPYEFTKSRSLHPIFLLNKTLRI